MLVIDAPGRTGTLGTFIAEIEIRGNMTANGPCSIGELENATWDVFGGVVTGSSANFFNPGTHFGRITNCPANNGGTPPPTVRTSTVATFMYGTPFQFDLKVDARANVTATNAASSSSAQANISYRWLGMQRLAPNATPTSRSGVDWSRAVP